MLSSLLANIVAALQYLKCNGSFPTLEKVKIVHVTRTVGVAIVVTWTGLQFSVHS